MQTEDCIQRWSPCQDSIDQPTTAVQNLSRDLNEVLLKRAEVHAQKFAFLRATLPCGELSLYTFASLENIPVS
ncbi:MAG TPA: hypothetical protein DIT97_15985 [Gimesia maris]|uniref:Uncharacterized protein n=1 Tax=Gimesia maris TaxID=122 RepID=A0A3D3R6K1_9PLAN|nr:hypothetical protein [Gimesia maris]